MSSYTGNPKRDQWIERGIRLTKEAGEQICVVSVASHLPEKFGLTPSELIAAEQAIAAAAALSERRAVQVVPVPAAAPVPLSPFTVDDWREALTEQHEARVALIAAQRAKQNTQGRVIEARERIAAGQRPVGPTHDEVMREHLATQQRIREENAGRRPVNAIKARMQLVRLPDGRLVAPAMTGRRFGSTFQTQGATNFDPARGGVPHNETGT